MKKKSLKSLKTKCWKLFSLMIRLKETDKRGYGMCVTCGNARNFKELQAGHFVDGRGNSILFDERGVHIQCAGCNVFKSGNKLHYWKWMEKNYGRGVIDELMILAKQPKKFTIEQLEEMAKNLTLRYSELMQGKNE